MPVKAGSAHQAIAYIAKLYATEKTPRVQLKNGVIAPDEFCEQRRQQLPSTNDCVLIADFVKLSGGIARDVVSNR